MILKPREENELQRAIVREIENAQSNRLAGYWQYAKHGRKISCVAMNNKREDVPNTKDAGCNHGPLDAQKRARLMQGEVWKLEDTTDMLLQSYFASAVSGS